MNPGSRLAGLLTIPVVACVLFLVAEWRPVYFSNVTYLGGLLLLEIMIVAVWHYQRWFFPMLMVAFVWAGSALPFSGAGAAVRWVFLIVGGLVGIVKWAELERRRHLGAIHLVAGLCVLSAAVSAMVSSRTETSLLKCVSLFLLFLYGSCGGRAAVAGREAAFFRGLVTACEFVSYLTAFLYMILRFEVFGNPNSLGAVMGVVIVPVLLWGVLIAEDRDVRIRRTVALGLAALLLASSLSRAGILGCAVALTIMCVVLRRHLLLLKGAFVLVFLVVALAVVQPAKFDALQSSFTQDVLYKGKPETGLLGSRQSPWQETTSVIKENPWFGSGFGTDRLLDQVGTDSVFRTLEGSNREHGNSYLALLQYVGVLGVFPFVILLILVLQLIFRSCAQLRRTADAHHFAVPLVLVCMAGLIHAFFEDWLFAVGYYLCLFFWTSVFILSDVQPQRARGQLVLRNAWNKTQVSPSRLPLSANQ